MKLTQVQSEWLDWVRSAGGVIGVTDRRTANPLLKRGFVSYDTSQDTWRITEAGRAALTGGKPE